MNLPGPFYMPKKGQHKIKDEFTKKRTNLKTRPKRDQLKKKQNLVFKK